MKRYLILALVSALLAACSSAPSPDPSQLSNPKLVLGEAPSWMEKLPSEKGYVYASATTRSHDYEMAVEKAVSIAQGKIAEELAGVVTNQTKSYRQDRGEHYYDNVENLVEKQAFNVDISGAELVEKKVVREGDGYFRVFALVRLGYGDGNVVRRLRNETPMAPSQEVIDRKFNELDAAKAAQAKSPVLRSVDSEPGPDGK